MKGFLLNDIWKLKPSEALLLGNLRIVDDFKDHPPLFHIEVWCPYCKSNHIHSYNVSKNAYHISFRDCHCLLAIKHDPQDGQSDECGNPIRKMVLSESPFCSKGYWIALDPSQNDHHLEIIEVMIDKISRWYSLHPEYNIHDPLSSNWIDIRILKECFLNLSKKHW